MTSHSWEPGNTYGGYKSPSYNALSYTWGRYELSDKTAMPEVKAVDINGVSWNIPRVTPFHFTAARLEAVISDSACSHPSEDKGSGVDFLWLDVACIDQTPESPDKAGEIGRQAKIFQGAAEVFVWLTTHDRCFYIDWAARMEPQFQIMCGANFHTEVDIRGWVITIKELVEEMIADPWFSSLWTLQELFLSPNAAVIPGDAMKGDIDMFRLNFLSDAFQTFKDALSHDDTIREIDEQCGLSAVIDETGLLVCLDRNAMGLLHASGRRTTRFDEDRVYGIMQVFDLQLGKSAPHAEPDQEYTLEELNDQLGAALIEKEPVLSQLYIYDDIVAPGKGWRINRSSIVPSRTQNFYHRRRVQPKTETRVTLSTHRVNQSLWGHFDGLTLPFPTFVRYLYRDWPNAWSYGSATILLDKGILDQSPEDHHATNIARAVFLAHYTPQVIILLLGLQSKAHDQAHQRSAAGLLLHRIPDSKSTGIPTWKRVGLLIWSIEPERLEAEATKSNTPYKLLANCLGTLDAPGKICKHLPYLTGDDTGWTHQSGLYG